MKSRISFEGLLGLIILIMFFYLIFSLFSNINKTTNNENKLTLSANFYNIGNLVTGNSIKINGVSVGTINQITLNKDTFIANIELILNNNYDIPIDSIASISSDGLIGNSYINISPGKEISYIKNDGIINNTIDAVSLENIISDIIFSN